MEDLTWEKKSVELLIVFGPNELHSDAFAVNKSEYVFVCLCLCVCMCC